MPSRRRAIVAGPLALLLAVPGGWLALRAHGPHLPTVRTWEQDRNHTDGLKRYVVTLTRATHDSTTAAAVHRMKAAGGRPAITVTAGGTREVVDTAGHRPPIVIVAHAAAPIAQLARARGVRHLTRLHDGTVLVAVTPATNVSVLPGVAKARPDRTWATASLRTLPSDTYASSEWALHNDGTGQEAIAGDDVGALDAWTRSRGHGVVIADLDTGYDTSQPDLQTGLWRNPGQACDDTDGDGDSLPGDCHGWNFYLGSADLDNVVDGSPASEHGTETAGTMVAAAGNGVGGAGLAPEARVMPLVIGSGSTISTALAAEAVYYAVDHGATIINCSFGGPTDDPSFDEAVAYAGDHGVLVVVAAGNDSADRDSTPLWPADLRAPNVISVGASTPSDGVASFSAYGATTVDLFAPGSHVVVPMVGGGFGLADGTSLAAPMVSATAALLTSLDPSLTATDLRQRILSTVVPRITFANYSVSGGRLSAAAAVATVPQPVSFGYSGLDGLTAAQPATVGVALSGSGAGLPDGPLSVKVSVAARYNGKVYAVTGLPIDAGAAGSGTTGDDGSVRLAPPGLDSADLTSTLALSLMLPGGDFALVSQLYAGTTPVSRASAAIFGVGAAAGTPIIGSGGDGGSPVIKPSASGSPEPSASDPAPDGAQPSLAAAPSSDASDGGAPGSAATTTEPAAAGGPAPTSSSPTAAPTTGPAERPSANAGAPGPTTSRLPSVGGSTSAAPRPTSSGGTATPLPSTSSAASHAPATGPAPGPTETVPPTSHFGITSISPASGSTAGGDTVTIDGTRLPTPVFVLFDHEAATVLSSSDTQATVQTPAHPAGRAEIEVYAQDNTEDVLPDAFTFVDPAGSGTGAGDPTTAPTADAPGGATTAPDGATAAPGGGDSGPSASAPGTAASPAPASSAPALPVEFGNVRFVDTGGTVGGADLSTWAMPVCGDSCDGVEVG